VLNDHAGSPLRFHVTYPIVLFTALYAKRMTSSDPIDKSKGWVKEADIGLWIPVQGGKASNPDAWGDYLLPVYLFVDSGAAISAGREVFGFPKLLGTFERKTEDPDDDARVIVHTQYFERFGPDAEAVVAPILAIDRVEAAEIRPSRLQSAEALVASGFGANLLARTRRRISSLLDFTPYGFVLPMIFLKQFRGLARPNAACYQAITIVNTQSVGEAKIDELSHPYALRLWSSDSHPIAADLGLRSGQEALTQDLPPFKAKLDFTVGFGSVLWEAEAGETRS